MTHDACHLDYSSRYVPSGHYLNGTEIARDKQHIIPIDITRVINNCSEVNPFDASVQ